MKNISHIKDNIKRKVLVVDDEFINQQILGRIISNNYEPVYASNGLEALNILKENDHISLILLDLNMPEMDGYEFMEIVFGDNVLSRIPIIVLTSEKSAEIKSLKMGARDFILKPYDMPEIILARIERTILLKEENDMIAKTARDTLTNLFTKKYFFEYIEEFREVNPNMSMDAVAINIRHFSLFNDMNGRKLGDQLLIRLAKSLQDLFVKYEGIVSRINGDTFYLFLSHQENFQPILDFLTTHSVLEELPHYHLELRIGIFPNCESEISIEKSFDNANRACRSLQNNYYDHIKYYDEEMHRKEIYGEKLLLEAEEALEEGQFKLYLQPKMDIRGDTPIIVGAEALVRWIHPTYGFISPGVFVPLFEKNGMIQKLDRFIWSEAGKRIKKWKEQFDKCVPVSVNVSRIDILTDGFEKAIIDVINDNELSFEELHLEITESAYSAQADAILKVLHHLHSLGFKIEIDDFGTGYSSLSLVTTMPFDILKIDMSFIRNMLKSKKDLKVVELILEIAGFIGAKTVSEGVENEEQYKLLKQLGCDIIQGYYFDKPLPADEFEDKYLR